MSYVIEFMSKKKPGLVKRETYDTRADRDTALDIMRKGGHPDAMPVDPVELDPVTEIENYAVIIRCCWCRGEEQAEAMRELDRRRLWLSPDQKRQAGQALVA